MAKTTPTYITIDVDGRPAVAELDRMKDAAGDADKELEDLGDADKLSPLDQGIGALTDKLGVLAGPAAAGAVGAAIFKLASGAADAAVEADTLATALDTSVEDASRLAAAFGDVGIETNDIADIGLQITGALEDDVELAERLGVEIGSTVEPIEAIRLGIDNWNLLRPTERARLFGEEGVRQISRMVAEGKTLEEILSEVEAGRIFSDEDAAQAREFQATMADIKGIAESITNTIGGELVDDIVAVTGLVRNLKQTFADLVPDIPGSDGGFIGSIRDAASTAINPLGQVGEILGELDEMLYGVDDAADILTPSLDAVANAGRLVGQAIGEASSDSVTSIGEVESAYGRLLGRIDDRQAYLNLKDSFDEVEAKALEAWTAAATGADDAEEKGRDYEQALLDLQVEVGQYGEDVLGLPDDKLTELVLDVPNVQETEALIDQVARFREVNLALRVTGLSQLASIPSTVAAPEDRAGSTAVTVNMPTTTSARNLESTLTRWTRINGTPSTNGGRK